MAKKKPTNAELIALLTRVAEEGQQIRNELCYDGKQLLAEIRDVLDLGHSLEEEWELQIVFEEGVELMKHPEDMDEYDFLVTVKCNGKEYHQGSDFRVVGWSEC